MFLLPHLRRLSAPNSHNTSNSFSRFFSVSNPGYTKKKEPLSEEEKNRIVRERKEKKAAYLRIWRAKPENKEKKRESNRIWKAKPENQEKIRVYNANNEERLREDRRKYEANNKELRRLYEANNKEKRLANKKRRYIEKMKKINGPSYVHKPRKKPEHDWKVQNSTKSFFEKVGKKLKIVKKSDWYQVSNAQIRENGGGGAIARHRSLGFALKFVYPRYPWDMERFQYHKKLAAQRYLRITLEGLLPKHIVLEYNFTKDPSLYLEGSTFPSQYDFFIKEWRLAIEYQGEQHYLDIRPVKYTPFSERQKRDAAKLASARKHGITLVYIPYWWDRKSESLSSTLHQFLPDRFPKTDSPPIPTELPPDYQKIKKTVLSPNKKIMMGNDIDISVDEIEVKGWFMSEKFDGIRAYWDGKGNFWSKNGKIINVPESFKQLPPFPLDGELWGGYGDNASVLASLKNSCGNSGRIIALDWTNIKFCVFDAPEVEGTYDKRHLFLKNNLAQYCNSNISLIPVQKCEGKEHLEKHLEEIMKKGGEGIMIYNPNLPYHAGRCNNVLKVKKYYESPVTFLELSKEGLFFKCKQNNGSVVWLKVTGGYYMRPPKVGSEIPVKHQGFFANSQNFKYPVLIEPLSAKEKKEARKEAKKQPKKPNTNSE